MNPLQFLFWGLFSFLIGVQSHAQTRLNPHGTGVVLLHPATHEPIGSAAHVCLEAQQEFTYFVTAAHVVQGHSRLLAPSSRLDQFFGHSRGVDLRVIFVDTSMDLALLQGPFALSRPCLGVSSRDISVPRVYNLGAHPEIPLSHVQIEGFDPNSKAIARWEYETPIARSIAPSYPGRKGTGPYLMIDGIGHPGMSGSIVTAMVDRKTWSPMNYAEAEHRWTPFPPGHPIFIGIVLGTDSAGRATAILSAEAIAQRLREMRFRPGTQNEFATGGGVRFLDIGATLWRPRWIDNGTGRLVERRNEELGGDALPGGIEANGKHWLALGSNWTEGEPIPDEAWSALSSPQSGIYMEQGQLKLSSDSVPKIQFLDTSMALVRSDFGLCKTVEAQMRNHQGASKPLAVQVCEQNNAQGAKFSLSVQDFPKKGSVYSVQSEFLKDCRNGECTLDSRAQKFVEPNSKLRPDQFPSWNQKAGASLNAKGLREFQGSETWLRVDRYSGFTLELSDSKGTVRIEGPVAQTAAD